MWVSTPSHLKPRRRHSAPTASLIALCVLAAALTLAPDAAMAADTNPGTAECGSTIGSGRVYWDPVANRFCAGGSGGGTASDGKWGIGPGGSASSDGRIVGEPIWVWGVLKGQPAPTKSPSRFLLVPSRGGRGDWGGSDEKSDGSTRPAPSSGGTRSGEKPKKPEPKKPEQGKKEPQRDARKMPANEFRCFDTLSRLEFPLYQEAQKNWDFVVKNELEKLAPHDRMARDLVANAKKAYQERNALLNTWKTSGCAAILKKKLPPAYGGGS